MRVKVPYEVAERWKNARKLRKARDKLDSLFWEIDGRAGEGLRFHGGEFEDLNERVQALYFELTATIARLERDACR